MIHILRLHFIETVDYLQHGGIIIFPLIATSFVMWAMIINRLIVIRAYSIKDIPKSEAKEYILSNRQPDIKKLSGIRALLVYKFMCRRCGKSHVDKYIIDEIVMSLISSLDRYLSIIGVLAAVCPLFGLLGTVTGMTATFDTIALFGTGNAKAMAAGISEALITTQTGLFVAIPGMYMHNFIIKRVNNLKHKIASDGFYITKCVMDQ